MSGESSPTATAQFQTLLAVRISRIISTMSETVTLALLACLMVVMLAIALVSGKVIGTGFSFARNTEPVGFWVGCATYAACFVALVYGAALN